MSSSSDDPANRSNKKEACANAKPARWSYFLFLELDSPPPFFKPQLSQAKRAQLDKWFIGERSQHYYLHRFKSFDKSGRLGARWHWAAFFMTLPWLLYRKRFLDALVYCVAGWSFIQLNATLVLLAAEYMLIPFISHTWHMPTRIGLASLVWLGYSALVACWADAYYYRVARREIADVVDSNCDDAQAEATLTRLGGVSVLGMLSAFGLFVFVLMIIKQQFLPLYAKQIESEILFHTFDAANKTKLRAEAMLKVQGACPTHLPASSVNTRYAKIYVQIAVSDDALKADGENVNDKSVGDEVARQCKVVATVADARFPNRNLNGRSIYLTYTGSRWHCTSSFNTSQTPKSCMFD